MNKSFIFIFLLQASVFCCYGQGIAPNWILNDCSSNPHNLYAHLDSQEVVVMAFVMGCSSCTNAGNYLINLKDQYAISHPGKVNFFLMDYYPSNTCTNVDTTWASYNFDALFSGCWAEKEVYYPTLYPMPAVVIAAGNYHTVIYESISWQVSDTALIKAAIDQFFVTVGVESNLNDKTLLLYPNPVKDNLYVNLHDFDTELLKLNVYDMMGEKVEGLSFSIDKNILEIGISELPSGQYILELIPYTSQIIRKIFVKN